MRGERRGEGVPLKRRGEEVKVVVVVVVVVVVGVGGGSCLRERRGRGPEMMPWKACGRLRSADDVRSMIRG